MANQIVLNNFLVNDRAVSAQGKLNAGSRLRLFRSSITPSPADTLAMYSAIESNFDTYTVKLLTGTWLAPVKIQDGEYQTLCGSQTYGSPASTADTIYGLFVDDGTTNLLFSMLFDSPITYSIGAPALTLQIGYQVWAKSIVP